MVFFFAADEPDAKTLVAVFLSLAFILRFFLDVRNAFWPTPARGMEPATRADLASTEHKLSARIAHVEEYAHRADHDKRDMMHALTIKVERLCVLAERNATWHRGRPDPPPPAPGGGPPGEGPFGGEP